MRQFIVIVFTLIATPLFALGEVTSYKLDNGLEIVVIEDHRAPIVTHMVWYRVGAADEPKGKAGIAHYLEHLMFKGTEELAPGEFSQIIAAQGGQENAFTSQDYTAYYQRVAVDRLALMMSFEADRMQNLRLTDEETRPELDVVLEERAQRTDSNPNSLFGEHRSALLYGAHPYGLSIIGPREEIEGLRREDAIAFYKAHYAPNNAILVVAGDVLPEEVLALAQEHYGAIEPNDDIAERQRIAIGNKAEPLSTVFQDPRVSQPYLVREYIAANRKTGDQREAAALNIFAQLLGGSGVTSYLGQELQLKQGLVLDQSAWHSALSLDPNSFGIFLLPANDVTRETLSKALDQALMDYLEQGVDEDHLARVKQQILAAETFALDNQMGQARRYGAALTSGLSVKDVQDWPKVLASITREEIMAAAKRLINSPNAVTGWIEAPKVTE